MAKFLNTHFSFSNGELNPRLLGRTDLREYLNAGKEVTNFLVSPQGGVNEVVGTAHVRQVTSTTPISFTFDDRYAVTINTGDVANPLGVEEIYTGFSSTYSGAVFPQFSASVSIGYFTAGIKDILNNFDYGTHVTIGDVSFITDKDGSQPPLVLVKGNTGIITVYTYNDWAKLNGDFDKTAVERELSSYPYFRNPVPDDTVNIQAGNVVSFSSGFPYGVTSFVDKFLKISDGATDYVIRIDDSSGNYTNITGAVPVGNYNIFEYPTWSRDSYPKLVSYFQQRLIFSTTAEFPDTLSFSTTGNLAEFSKYLIVNTPATPDESASFFIQPDTIDTTPINWIVIERYITCGSDTEEYIIQGLDGVFSSSASTVRSISNYGSTGTNLALRVQSSTLFVEKDGKTLREISFSEENGGYVSRNIGFLGPEIDLIERLDYDYSAKRVYITTVSDVHVLGYDTSIGITGWSTIDIGESFKVGGMLDINGDVPLIKRGNKIELLQTYTETNSALFVDFPIIKGLGLIQVTFIDGNDRRLNDISLPVLQPFIGGTVQVFNEDTQVFEPTTLFEASGHPTFANGQLYITTTYDAKYIALDSGVSSAIETTPIQQGSPIGDSQIGYQRVDKAGLRLFETKEGFKVGGSPTSLEVVSLDGEYTGMKEVHIDGCPDNDFSVRIENDSSFPMVLLSIAMRGLESEG